MSVKGSSPRAGAAKTAKAMEEMRAMALEREIQTYKERLSELLKDQGKFVLIRGDEVVGIFESCEAAVRHGYELFGLEPFLAREIREKEIIPVFWHHVR